MNNNIIIPTTIVDNFFDNPDKVRQWAIQQSFRPDELGRWPGLRSKQISELDNLFFDSVVRKSLSLFFDLQQEIDISWVASMGFQIVHKNYDSGWVHSDVSVSQITGIVYLNKDTNLAGGTSIMRKKENILSLDLSFNKFKEESYLKKRTIQEVEEYREKHNNQFEETINISNVYNRLVLFDSHLYHKAQSFFGEDDDARLTLVFFISKLLVNNSPISRLHRVL
jgi:hypothetical protein